MSAFLRLRSFLLFSYDVGNYVGIYPISMRPAPIEKFPIANDVETHVFSGMSDIIAHCIWRHNTNVASSPIWRQMAMYCLPVYCVWRHLARSFDDENVNVYWRYWRCWRQILLRPTLGGYIAKYYAPVFRQKASTHKFFQNVSVSAKMVSN